MKKNIWSIPPLLIVFVLIIASCDFDKTPDPDAVDPNEPVTGEPDCNTLTDLSYATDVLPIFTEHCATSGCHDATTAKRGYNYELYADAKRSVDNNLLIGMINHESGFSAMPLSYKMEDCEITKITTWVNEGALDN